MNAAYRAYGILMATPDLEIWAEQRNGRIVGMGRFVGELRRNFGRRVGVSPETINTLLREKLITQTNSGSESEGHFSPVGKRTTTFNF